MSNEQIICQQKVIVALTVLAQLSYASIQSSKFVAYLYLCWSVNVKSKKLYSATRRKWLSQLCNLRVLLRWRSRSCHHRLSIYCATV